MKCSKKVIKMNKDELRILQNDDEIFKTCLEYWYFYAKDLYLEETRSSVNPSIANPGATLILGGFVPQHQAASKRIQMYERVLHHLRIVIIDKMAKPEEVIIVEDENGEIVREMTKDTEMIAQYKQMRDTIVYLTNFIFLLEKKAPAGLCRLFSKV